MKPSSARIAAHDPPLLPQFYRDVSGIAPIGNGGFLSFRPGARLLAFSRRSASDPPDAGAAPPVAKQP